MHAHHVALLNVGALVQQQLHAREVACANVRACTCVCVCVCMRAGAHARSGLRLQTRLRAITDNTPTHVNEIIRAVARGQQQRRVAAVVGFVDRGALRVCVCVCAVCAVCVACAWVYASVGMRVRGRDAAARAAAPATQHAHTAHALSPSRS